MAAPREHPINRLVIIVEETARLMWRAYDAHISTPRYDEAWQVKASEIFSRCNACEERVFKLKHIRTTTYGSKTTRPAGSDLDAAAHARTDDAEWEVRKLRVLLASHAESFRPDEKWKMEQLRLLTALKNAVGKLVRMVEENGA
jgi:hypothetical protein